MRLVSVDEKMLSRRGCTLQVTVSRLRLCWRLPCVKRVRESVRVARFRDEGFMGGVWFFTETGRSVPSSMAAALYRKHCRGKLVERIGR